MMRALYSFACQFFFIGGAIAGWFIAAFYIGKLFGWFVA